MNEIFEQVYIVHFQKIYNYVFVRLLNHHDTEDVVSEVFLKAFINLTRFEERNGAAVSTWLFSIALNAVNDHFRKVKRSMKKLPGQGQPPLSNDISAWEERESLLELLGTLDDHSREAIELRYWGDMSYAEIATCMGRTEKGISMVLSRGMARLRETFNNFYDRCDYAR